MDVQRIKCGSGLWAVVILTVLLFLVGASGLVIASSGVSGVVVDANSGEPVEGVVVVAKWDIFGPEFSTVDVIAIEEALTDSGGTFEINGWGPRLNGRFWYAGLAGYAPELIVFKAGYVPAFKRNHQARTLAGIYRMTDALDGATIAIARRPDDLERYLSLITDVETRITRLLAGPNCRWREFPGLLMAMHRVGQTARHAGLDGRSLLVERIPRRDCGDPQEFFRGYDQ